MAGSGWRARLREQAPALAVEVFSVVLAVLLALGINSWQQSRENARLAAEAFTKVTGEVRANHRKLVEILDVQREELQALAGKLEAIEAGESPTLDLRVIAEQLRSAAWQTAVLTGAARFMDFEQVSELADIYHLQELVDAAVGRMLAAMTSVDIADEARSLPALKSFAGSWAQLLALEEELITRYEAFLSGRPET